MPRPPRINEPGIIFHAMARGVKGNPLFYEDEDRQDFFRDVLRAFDEFPGVMHAYSLMTNHYHLLLQLTQHSLSDFMHRVNTRFAKRFNRRYGQRGHVLQARFHSIPVDVDSYFATVCQYIHLNAVRAGIVARPEDYPWSNYRDLIYGVPNRLVDPTFMLEFFSEDPKRQRDLYRKFVEEQMRKPELINEKVLFRMRAWGSLKRAIDQNKPTLVPGTNGGLKGIFGQRQNGLILRGGARGLNFSMQE